MLGESAIDIKPSGTPIVVSLRHGSGNGFEGFSKLIDPLAGFGADLENWKFCKGAAGEGVTHILGCELDHLFVDEVGFREDD